MAVESLLFEKKALETAYRSLDTKIKNALQIARDRVRFYHEKQLEARDLVLIGLTKTTREHSSQFVRGMERVGIYVPGGKQHTPQRSS